VRQVARRVALATALWAFASAAAAVEVEEIALQVPLKDAQGRIWMMPGRVCRPATRESVPLAIINHGSTSNALERATVTPEPCDGEIARWFVARGFAAVFVVRLGHGKTTSPWIEEFHCTREGFRQSGLATARQIEAIVETASRLPNIATDRTVVVGHSAGGWGTIAYASMPHPHAIAAINISGGRGGHYLNKPNSNCHSEHLIEAAADFGKTATLPMLWVYARNDSWFGPALVESLQRAFNAAGGSAQLVETDASGDEGHALFYVAPEMWGPTFVDYLASRGALPVATPIH
jgi:dienelactone hydrolase